jgi:hypothetical protein
MIKTKVYGYNLTVETPVIVSPRQSNAFYKNPLIPQADKGFPNQYNIVYPFYRYGDYELFDPCKARYYIPGSSIKGALTAGLAENDRKPLSLFVDDISVGKDNIVIIPLKKLQYINSLKPPMDKTMPKFKPFFPGVGIEVLIETVNVKLCGALRYDASKCIAELLNDCRKNFQDKMRRYSAQLATLKRRLERFPTQGDDGETRKKICLLLNYCDNLANDKGNTYFFLGGFKGLIRSVMADTSDFDKIDSAIFVSESNKPLGIVKIELVGGDD